ncbi:glycosyltransferase family 4 protein [uncultured Thiodictyon sp.]|uniref:glycosyltransferase family 4 protein n=1 Tax=uncultured Thiodictyon sp. TaxID=1846217 RepID=UPI0025E24762|nr:glycosyltransferase family 4 protein [uncultured Thiodictyon sp.]
MGRFLVYLLSAIARDHPEVQCGVVDSYGPGPRALMPFWFAAALARLIWQGHWQKTDVVHIHMAAFGSAARKLILAAVARRLGLLVVLHLHGSRLADFIDGLSPRRRGWLVRQLTAVDRLVVIGHYWQDYLTRRLGIPTERVTIIFNGVPDPGWRSDTRATPASAGREPEPKPCKLLALGELGPRKGTPEILSALATPDLQQRAWVATLAGNGLVAHYRAQLRGLGLATRVSLPGWLGADEARGLLAQSDILLLPSRWEGLPIAILEAMAAGVAVIATPVGAVADAITNGETGLLTAPGDVSALAEAIVQLIDDPKLRSRLVLAARKRFERLFSIARTADRVVGLYRCLMKPEARDDD